MTLPMVERAQHRWVLRDPEAHLKGIPRFPRITATVLAARGITTREQADYFYKPHLLPVHNPLELPGMLEAITRVRTAIAEKELVALYGDFDVDGVTSVAVLTLGLKPLGAHTRPYIPERFSEGYGLNTDAIQKLHDEGVSLLITADCGISSVAEVDFANGLGMDVIILDHHTVPDIMPAAFAAVNPKRLDSEYPFDEMAAVGVSFRFLQMLYDTVGRQLNEQEFIDLVALGTVVDVAPLVDENRTMVVAGLDQMHQFLRPGLQALVDVARTAPDRIGAETLGFALGPRMNAAGRLSHADRALALMLEERPHAARALAEELDKLNRQRQVQTEEAALIAEEQLGATDDPILFITSSEIHAGIVGIVAGRIAERRNRPTIVLNQGPTESRASARSIPAFDIVRAIRSQKHLLVRHGGHRAAAGFTIRNEHLDEFKRNLVAYAEEMLDQQDLRRVQTIDATCELHEVAGIDVRGLLRFEPCGQGNPKPLLLSRGVEVRSWKTVGADGKHLKLFLRDGTAAWQAIAFNKGDVELSDHMDIVYSLQPGWRGNTVELEIKDLAPSALAKPLETD